MQSRCSVRDAFEVARLAVEQDPALARGGVATRETDKFLLLPEGEAKGERKQQRDERNGGNRLELSNPN